VDQSFYGGDWKQSPPFLSLHRREVCNLQAYPEVGAVPAERLVVLGEPLGVDVGGVVGGLRSRNPGGNHPLCFIGLRRGGPQRRHSVVACSRGETIIVILALTVHGFERSDTRRHLCDLAGESDRSSCRSRRVSCIYSFESVFASRRCRIQSRPLGGH
jgi:hypothetical protein